MEKRNPAKNERREREGVSSREEKVREGYKGWSRQDETRAHRTDIYTPVDHCLLCKVKIPVDKQSVEMWQEVRDESL